MSNDTKIFDAHELTQALQEAERMLSIARSNVSVSNQMFEKLATENTALKRRVAELELALANAMTATQPAGQA